MIIPLQNKNKIYSIISSALFLLIVWVLYRGFDSLDYNWRWGRVPRYFFTQVDGQWQFGILLQGLGVTLQLSFFGSIIAFAVGVGVVAGRMSARPSLQGLAVGYTQIMRCTPLLVQLYLLYFMFSNLFNLDAFWVGVLALAAFESAFVAEILRSGIASVSRAQIDAGDALGFKRLQRWRFVIIPQALPLVLPPLTNLFVSLIKHSSIVTIIAIPDLTDSGRNLIADTFLTFELWFVVGMMYVVICYPLAWGIGRWEKRLRRHSHER